MTITPNSVVVIVHQRNDLSPRQHFALIGVAPFVTQVIYRSTIQGFEEFQNSADATDVEEIFSEILQQIVLAHCSDACPFFVFVHGSDAYHRLVDGEMIELFSTEFGFSLDDVSVVTLRGQVLISENVTPDYPYSLYLLDS